jgi:hypothetical protein
MPVGQRIEGPGEDRDAGLNGQRWDQTAGAVTTARRRRA